RTALAESIQRLGAGRSVVVDRVGRIIAGNKTVAQATALALPIRVVETTGTELVVVRRTDLDLTADARARELALADKRVSELDLAWDPTILAQHLATGMDLSAWWTPDELARLTGTALHPGLTEDDRAIMPRPTTLQRGDLVQLGRHRVLCGDATDA